MFESWTWMKNIFLSVNDVGVIIKNNFSKPFIEWTVYLRELILSTKISDFLSFYTIFHFRFGIFKVATSDTWYGFMTRPWDRDLNFDGHWQYYIAERLIAIEFLEILVKYGRFYCMFYHAISLV